MEAVKIIKSINFCGLCTTGNCHTCDRKTAKDEAIKALEEISHYRDLGSVQNIQDVLIEHMQHEPILKSYQHIGTQNECYQAVEKQKARKVRSDSISWYCPNCHSRAISKKHHYCFDCGQKLGW